MMRTVKAGFVIVCLFIAVFIWTVKADEELQNLVKNPDFEDAMSGWGVYDGNAASVYEIQEKGGVGDNGRCFFIEVTAVEGGTWYVPNLYSSGFVSLEDSTEYTCTLWARTEEGMDKDITLTIQRGADPWTRFNQESFTIDGEWNEYSMTWTQPETLVNAWVMIHTPGSPARVEKGKLWVDHVRVYEGEYQEDELSEGKILKSVEPADKLVTVWGNMKAQ